MRRTLDPKLDVVFKLLFAQPENRELLVSLLTAVLQPATPIVEVSVLNPEVPRMVARDKGAVLDLLVRLGDGSLVDVEMQTRSRPGLRARAAYYWARMLASELRRGQDHERLRKTVLVLLLGQRELRTERFHCIFQLREVREHELLTELCEIHTVELPKLGGVAAEGEEGALVRWGRFFWASTDEELEELAAMDTVMSKAKGALELLSAEPSAQELARQRELAELTYEHSLAVAREEARAEGEARGRAEGEARGKAEGKAEGEVRGKAEGRAEGEARGKAEAILSVLAARGLLVPEAVAAQVRSCRDPEQLEAWLRRAVLVGSAGELLA